MCRYEFCWICLGEYPGYVHSSMDNGEVCGQRQIVLAIFYVLWGGIIFIKLMQQIQLFTDSVSEFLFTQDTELLIKNKHPYRIQYADQLVPVILFILRILQALFVFVLSFMNSQTIVTGLNYYKRLSANNPHLSF